MQNENIFEFLNFDKVALVGVSRNSRKFGNYILNELIKKGKKVFPVNPFLNKINGIKCYNSVDELPLELKHIIIVTKPQITNQLVPQIIKKGIQNIWFQQGSSDKLTQEMCKNKNINFVVNQCIIMYLEPVNSFHKIHRIISKILNKYAA